MAIVGTTLDVSSRREWRHWLEQNHDKVKEIWLVYYKRGTETPSIGYLESIEEALCFGWSEGLLKSIDEERYARRFTPRRKDGTWSVSNVRRFERLKAQGLMTEAGEKVGPTKKTKVYTPIAQRTVKMPKQFKMALAKNPKAQKFFDSLAPGYRKLFMGWIENAKRPETRAKRVKICIEKLKAGKKMWM